MNLKKTPIHIHHIGSHFTSAMFPAASVLLTIFIFTGERSLERASFYCLLFGAAAAPFVYASGAYDWRTRFQARRTRIFDHKLFFGVIFVILSLIIIVSRVLWPDLMTENGSYKWVYLAMVYTATAVAGYLGHLGSKFI